MAHYNRVIDVLLSKGVKPVVTLYHFDLPQALLDNYGGWCSAEIIPAFSAYAEACFVAFGDRVKIWITVNEPTVDLAFNSGYHAPEDIEAADTAIAFRAGWFLDPLTFGHYPEVIGKTWGEALPSFTDEESELVKDSIDFLGLNFYTGLYVSGKPVNDLSNTPAFPVTFPSNVYIGDFRDQIPIGKLEQDLGFIPKSLESVVLMLKTKYGNIVTYITENGYAELRNPELSLEEKLHCQDDARIQYIREHLRAVVSALKGGVNVQGLFVWSLLNNFEWLWGYQYQ
ncbi:hypothetical protein R1sor_026136 [Riccia sorocarpa]|uniref:Beta-glucosidase n=1 Tax=Riccia sorocarpa TaxID=122646 RepID=A0ABD3GAK1_9MARC